MIRSSLMIHRSVEYFGRRLRIMYLKWQMQMIIINSKLEFLFLPNMLAPVELFPTRENLAALKVLAFLSARLNPAAVNLLVLPPTICRASPKTTPWCLCSSFVGWYSRLTSHNKSELLWCVLATTTWCRTKSRWQRSCIWWLALPSPSHRANPSIGKTRQEYQEGESAI